MIPFIFQSLAINAVGKAAMAMVGRSKKTVQRNSRNFRRNWQPEYDKCVDIVTKCFFQKCSCQVLSHCYAIISWFNFRALALGGFLAGAT